MYPKDTLLALLPYMVVYGSLPKSGMDMVSAKQPKIKMLKIQRESYAYLKITLLKCVDIMGTSPDVPIHQRISLKKLFIKRRHYHVKENFYHLRQAGDPHS